MTQHTRRRFLKTTAAASAAFGFPAVLRAAGVNERVTLGLIGCGGRGRRFFDRVDYVCDPDSQRLDAAREAAGLASSHAVVDMRRLLDNRDIDAVVIATPDHWHAPAALLACAAGKHVYVEKPVSHNLRESRLLVDAAQRTGRVVQHGTQHRSSPFIADAIALLRDGAIGETLCARCWNVQKRESIGHGAPGEPPAHVDYDMWVGPAEMTPFQENRFHYHWRWWRNFGTGDIGNDGCHELDIARWGLGADSLPTRVTASGGKLFHNDDQEFPDTAVCTFEFSAAAGEKPRLLTFDMRLWSTNYPYNCDSGVEFFGTEGSLMVSKRGKLLLLGPRNERLRELRQEKAPDSADQLNRAHLDDFIAAIRSGGATRCGAIEAHRTAALPHLANVALRTGRQVQFDPQTEQIIGDEQANELLGRQYRDGGHWARPAVT